MYLRAGKYLNEYYDLERFWQRRIDFQKRYFNKGDVDFLGAVETAQDALLPFPGKASLQVVKVIVSRLKRYQNLLKNLGIFHKQWNQLPEAHERILQFLEKNRQIRSEMDIGERFEDLLEMVFPRMYRQPPVFYVLEAQAICLVTWLLTDPDAGDPDLGITQFEDWPWTERNPFVQNYICFKGRKATALWMKGVRAAWAKIEAEKTIELAGTNPSSYLRSNSVSELIAQGENHTLEFKETLQYNINSKQIDLDVRHESLKTIAGFLNADGGTLLIGISDSGDVKGIGRDKKAINNANDDKFERYIRNYLSGQNSKFEPELLGYVDISFEKIQDHTICIIDVQPSPKQKIIHLEGKVYVRDGNQTLKLEGPNLTNWTKERC